MILQKFLVKVGRFLIVQEKKKVTAADAIQHKN